MRACVRACVRARARACVHACVRACVCVCVCMSCSPALIVVTSIIKPYGIQLFLIILSTLQTLNNLLQFSRQENQQIQNDFQNLKQLYNESQRDNQLLRTTLSKQEVRKKIGINEKQGKEHLIGQLEEANSKVNEI